MEAYLSDTRECKGHTSLQAWSFGDSNILDCMAHLRLVVAHLRLVDPSDNPTTEFMSSIKLGIWEYSMSGPSGFGIGI